MCLARSTPHTGSSGVQGLWSVIHSQTTSEPHPKGDGPPRGTGRRLQTPPGRSRELPSLTTQKKIPAKTQKKKPLYV